MFFIWARAVSDNRLCSSILNYNYFLWLWYYDYIYDCYDYNYDYDIITRSLWFYWWLFLYTYLDDIFLVHDILLTDIFSIHHSYQYSERRSLLEIALSELLWFVLFCRCFVLPFAKAEELSFPGIRDGNWKLFLLFI